MRSPSRDEVLNQQSFLDDESAEDPISGSVQNEKTELVRIGEGIIEIKSN